MIPKLILNKTIKVGTSSTTPKQDKLLAKVEEIQKKFDELKLELDDLKDMIKA